MPAVAPKLRSRHRGYLPNTTGSMRPTYFFGFRFEIYLDVIGPILAFWSISIRGNFAYEQCLNWDRLALREPPVPLKFNFISIVFRPFYLVIGANHFVLDYDPCEKARIFIFILGFAHSGSWATCKLGGTDLGQNVQFDLTFFVRSNLA